MKIESTDTNNENKEVATPETLKATNTIEDITSYPAEVTNRKARVRQWNEYRVADNWHYYTMSSKVNVTY